MLRGSEKTFVTNIVGTAAVGNSDWLSLFVFSCQLEGMPQGLWCPVLVLSTSNLLKDQMFREAALNYL